MKIIDSQQQDIASELKRIVNSARPRPKPVGGGQGSRRIGTQAG
jgi:hypothetical protein